MGIGLLNYVSPSINFKKENFSILLSIIIALSIIDTAFSIAATYVKVSSIYNLILFYSLTINFIFGRHLILGYLTKKTNK
jgi:hypothetical protein